MSRLQVAFKAGISILLCWALTSHGQTLQPSTLCPVPGPDEQVASYATRAAQLAGCLGEAAKDPHPLTKAVENILNKPPQSATDTKPLEEALTRLLAETNRSHNGFDDALWVALSSEISVMRSRAEALKSITGHEEALQASRAVVSSQWKDALTGGLDLSGATFNLVAPPPECQNGQPCMAFESRVAAIRVVRLISRADTYSEAPETLASFAAGRVRLGRWQAYRDKAHPLYWWEVFANGALMNGNTLSSDGKALCNTDGTGTSVGFCEVPTRQLVLLHPDSAVRFSRTANKASDLKSALTVELVGWYWWEWKNSTSAEMTGRRGLSLAAIYTDTQQEGKMSYGPMVHWDGYSFAMTKARQGRWSLVVSIPLAGEIFGRRQKIVDELSTVKKSSFAELLTD